MSFTRLVAALALLPIAPAAVTEVAPPPRTIFEGKAAEAEIGSFMHTRWYRQTWRIEFKAIAGLPGSDPVWHVAGTHEWVRLEGPPHLKELCDLAKLDTTSRYEFEAIPVDQNYGVITFYLLSPPRKVEVGVQENAGQGKAPEAPSTSLSTPVESITARDALCLAEACRITALINDGKWEEVEKTLGTGDGMVAILKQHATREDWQGIGAYRGVRLDPTSPRTVTFRFGFAPKSSPHELLITFTDGDPAKPALMVLGW